MKEDFDILELLKQEAQHFRKDGKIQDYGIISFTNEEASTHVFVSNDDITWRKYPESSKLSNVVFEPQVDKEKDFDFLITNLAADGFFISPKAKEVLEKFNLGDHKFYPAEILLKKGSLFRKKEVLNYFWLHLIFDEEKLNFVDFPNSVFKDKVSFQGDIISNEDITFQSIEEWRKYKSSTHENWLNNPETNNYHEITAWILKPRNDIKLPDILKFDKIDSGSYYFSEELAKAVKNSKLKGIKVSATGKIKSAK